MQFLPLPLVWPGILVSIETQVNSMESLKKLFGVSPTLLPSYPSAIECYWGPPCIFMVHQKILLLLEESSKTYPCGLTWPFAICDHNGCSGLYGLRLALFNKAWFLKKKKINNNTSQAMFNIDWLYLKCFNVVS